MVSTPASAVCDPASSVVFLKALGVQAGGHRCV